MRDFEDGDFCLGEDRGEESDPRQAVGESPSPSSIEINGGVGGRWVDEEGATLPFPLAECFRPIEG